MIKYRAKFKTRKGQIITVDLSIEGYIGDIIDIPTMAGVPFTHKTVGGGKDDDRIVKGSEAVLSVVTKDENFLLDVMESDYKDWHMHAYDEDDDIFKGWVQPDLISKNFIADTYQIQLSATDALKDLSDTDFDDAGELYTGRLSILQVLKEALTKTGIHLEFETRLNTHETSQGASTLAFVNTVDTRRFIENGEPVSCLEAIEMVLKPFDVTLQQYKGEYRINSKTETESYIFKVTWDNLTINKSASTSTDVVSVQDKKFGVGSTLSKQAPLKSLRVTHHNMNYGDTIVDNLDDFLNVWETDAYSGLSVESLVSGEQYMTATMTSGDPTPIDGDVRPYFNIKLQEDFPAAKVTETDYINVSFKTKLLDYSGLDFTHSQPAIKLEIRLYKPSVDSPQPGEFWVLVEQWRQWQTPFFGAFTIPRSGDYNVEFRVVVDTDFAEANWSAKVGIYDVDITRLGTVDGEITSEVSWEAVTEYKQKGRFSEERDIYVADSVQPRDIGALLKPGGDNTQLWSVENLAANKGLRQQYTALVMYRRSKYNDFISITAEDDEDITPLSIIDMEYMGSSRKFTVVNYDRNYRDNRVNLTLLERKRDEILDDEVDWPHARPPFGDTIEAVKHPNFPIWDIQVSGNQRYKVTDVPKPNGVISGGLITAISDTALNYAVSEVAYYIDGELKIVDTSSAVSFDAGEAQDRIDIIVADAEGNVTVRKGTAGSGIPPSRNRVTEVEIGRVVIQSGQTTPSDIIVVYDENIEWTTSAHNITADFDNTEDSYKGAKAIKVDSWNEGNLRFTTTAIDTSHIRTLSFAVKLRGGWAADDRIVVRVYDGGDYVDVSRGFTAIKDAYQIIAIDFGLFGFAQVDKIEIFFRTSLTDRPGVFLDYITLQADGNISQPEESDSHARLHEMDSPEDHKVQPHHADKIVGWNSQGKPSAKEVGELPEYELPVEHPTLIGNESYLASAYAILQAIQANVAGLNPKEEVHAATTENITLSGLQTIDTVELVADNRVLVKDQTNAAENGIYLVASGDWARAGDADTYDKHAAAYVLVSGGDDNRNVGYYCTAETGGTLGTTDIDWIVFSRPGDYDMVNVGGGAAIFKTQDGFTFKLRTLSSPDATFTEVGDEVNMALLGVEATMNNHFVQQLAPDVAVKEEGDTWTRPSDWKTFELYVDGETRFWIERTSPKII